MKTYLLKNYNVDFRIQHHKKLRITTDFGAFFVGYYGSYDNTLNVPLICPLTVMTDTFWSRDYTGQSFSWSWSYGAKVFFADFSTTRGTSKYWLVP